MIHPLILVVLVKKFGMVVASSILLRFDFGLVLEEIKVQEDLASWLDDPVLKFVVFLKDANDNSTLSQHVL